jgi:hypothetical protein
MVTGRETPCLTLLQSATWLSVFIHVHRWFNHEGKLESFLREGIRLPDGAIVEGTWHRKQAQAKEIKEDHQDGHAKHQLHRAHDSHETATLRQGYLAQLLQARRTDDAIIVFRDALAAIEPAALRTAGSRFAGSVVKAALMAEKRHLNGD